MARIRTIKPEIARHEGLFEAERATGLPLRFAWAVLPTACDREGRFKWRPRAMKADVLPYDDIDFETVLTELVERGFLEKYRVGGEWFGYIPTFLKHQQVNGKERMSELPGIDMAEEIVTRRPRVNNALPQLGGDARGEGKGREGNGESSPPPRVAEPPAPAFAEFPVVGDSTRQVYAVTTSQLAEWSRLFPGLNIEQEVRNALAWVLSEPSRRKTAKGMPRFLTGWFTRSNDRRGGSRQVIAHPNAGAADPAAERSKQKYAGLRWK